MLVAIWLFDQLTFDSVFLVGMKPLSNKITLEAMLLTKLENVFIK